MVPILLDMMGRLAVVVGGGTVGQRKATALLEGGARVRLVCLEPRPPEMAAPILEWRTEPYHPAMLDDATLVFAAATPSLNRQVVADARGRGLWVNAADDPEQGNFFLPAVVRRGALVLAVSTGGAAPALAREIRRRLAADFDEAFGHWIALLAELRPLIQARISHPGRRRQVFERLCEWDWLERMRQQDTDRIRQAMVALVESLVDGAGDPL